MPNLGILIEADGLANGLGLQSAFDYDINGNCIYEGRGLPGAAQSDASWDVIKRTYVQIAGVGYAVQTAQHAGGSGSLVNKYSDRTTLTYR